MGMQDAVVQHEFDCTSTLKFLRLHNAQLVKLSDKEENVLSGSCKSYCITTAVQLALTGICKNMIMNTSASLCWSYTVSLVH